MEHLLAARTPTRPTPIEIPADTPVQSLARGLAVLTALGGTLSEIAEATGLARATARRALLTLVELGYAVKTGNRFVALPRVLELGYARLSSLTLGELATPHLAALAEAVGESASVAVLDGTDIRYVARAPAYKIMSVDITVGTRFPAYATSMGRVLLADDADLGHPVALTPRTVTDPERLRALIRRARADGYAIVEDELEEGLRALAVPIRDRGGRVVAAVNVAMTGQVRPGLLAHLQATAHAVETDLALVAERTAPRPA
nr:IclR family transcriptional regulator C-terminal domain-containing protein [Herbidospora sp. NBRC 101105]